MAVTINGDRYRAILKEVLFTKIDEEDIGNICFRLYMPHTEVTLNVLRLVFENRIFSLRVDVIWSSRTNI